MKPGAWAKYAGESVLSYALPLLFILRRVLSPLIALLSIFDEPVRRLTGVPPEDAQTQADEIEREILSVVSEGEAHGENVPEDAPLHRATPQDGSAHRADEGETEGHGNGLGQTRPCDRFER